MLYFNILIETGFIMSKKKRLHEDIVQIISFYAALV